LFAPLPFLLGQPPETADRRRLDLFPRLCADSFLAYTKYVGKAAASSAKNLSPVTEHLFPSAVLRGSFLLLLAPVYLIIGIHRRTEGRRFYEIFQQFEEESYF
jgi:hypothetical protein